MRNFEATVLDFYDDGGALLKQVVPDVDDVPEFVKEAAALDQRSDPRLFALVMHEDGKLLKKYATADAGNTWLSTLYFWKTKDNLPIEAQKTAAAHLVQACEEFEISAPDFLFDIADGPVETNVVEVTGKRPPMRKVATSHREDVPYAIERADGSKYYPLADAQGVATAIDYFERNPGQFIPRERREYAVKVAAQAKKAALPLPPKLEKYASEAWNPHLEGHLTSRFMHLVEMDAPVEYRTMLHKMASVRSSARPEEFAQALEEFDRLSGLDALWDRWVADPWYSTLGLEKQAKGIAAPTATYTVGDATVTSTALHVLATRGLPTVEEHFGDTVAQAFQKDPEKIFDSMPLPQKRLFARLASTFADGH